MLPQFSTHSLTLLSFSLPLLSSALPQKPTDPVLQLNPSVPSYNAIFQPIQNPGFEAAGDISNIKPWTTTGQVELNTNPNDARNGSKSLHFTVDLRKRDKIPFSLSQKISVLPGQTYTLSFSARNTQSVGAGCSVDTCLGGDCTWDVNYDAGVGGYAGRLSDTAWNDIKRTWTAPGKKVGDIEYGADGNLDLGGARIQDFEARLKKVMVETTVEIRGGRFCADGAFVDNVVLELEKPKITKAS